MDEGKILIVNLGKCDHETRNLLGSLLVVNLEQAALSRANMPEEKVIHAVENLISEKFLLQL